jgi:hypothetical protein
MKSGHVFLDKYTRNNVNMGEIIRLGNANTGYRTATAVQRDYIKRVSQFSRQMDPFGGTDRYVGRFEGAKALDERSARVVCTTMVSGIRQLSSSYVNICDERGRPTLTDVRVLESREKDGIRDLVLEAPFSDVPSFGTVNTIDWMMPFKRQIFATYTDDWVRIYQAFAPEVGKSLLDQGEFRSGFNRKRFTWIKTSLPWIAKRSLWASASNQQMVLAIDIKRSFFDRLLLNSHNSSPFLGVYYENRRHYKSESAKKQNVVQWDPDRDWSGNRMSRKAIQIGVSPAFLEDYLYSIVSVQDITSLVKGLSREAVQSRGIAEHLPFESLYPSSDEMDLMLEARQYYLDEDPRIIGHFSDLSL